MAQICPVSDLRNKFTEIEKLLNEGQTVYFTKNVDDDRVVFNLGQNSELTDEVEMKLDEADRQATSTTERLSHQTVFANARGAAHAK
ncbi:MAG: type II toxin-antitoxin system Phd/YefM family antitoxin [Lachnospiraceae bacterium]|nr:type II toxin-antitoxin system Phd/YefM family antitoxin [Lachnospiraceae bacterium]